MLVAILLIDFTNLAKADNADNDYNYDRYDNYDNYDRYQSSTYSFFKTLVQINFTNIPSKLLQRLRPKNWPKQGQNFSKTKK